MELLQIFEWITTFTSFIVQLMGIDICFMIYKKGGTGNISAFPFVANFTCASLWLRYGIMQNLQVMIITQTSSTLLNFMYLAMFYYYTSKKTPFIRTMFINMAFIFAVLYYLKYQQTDFNTASSHLGILSAILSVLAYGSPLASLKDVILAKSTECLSFLYIVSNVIVAFEWVVYGWLLHDIYVQISNFLGFCLGLVQLSLFCIYPSKPSTEHIVNPLHV